MSAPVVIDDGGPVFPHLVESCQRINESELYSGISLRDYFAAKAIQGMLAARLAGAPEQIATAAYEVADAMLVTRKAQL
jgi:predicted chitinase